MVYAIFILASTRTQKMNNLNWKNERRYEFGSVSSFVIREESTQTHSIDMIVLQFPYLILDTSSHVFI